MKPEDFKGIMHSDREIMGGTPVFVGTRVPLQNLIDCLEGGESVEDFLEAYPTVTREQAICSDRSQLATRRSEREDRLRRTRECCVADIQFIRIVRFGP